MLRLDRIAKKFGGLPALSDVSLEVPEGRITALIGPNGAGKSTLVNCITGIIPPDRGSVVFEGKEITALPAHRIPPLGIARTFQNLRLFPRLSVLENVLCGLTVEAGGSFFEGLLRLPGTRSRERRLRLRALEALDEFGLAPQADLPVAVLPYGDRKRVELARAVVGGARLLLLDEPVAGLNAAETAQVAVRLQRLRARGLTLLLIEHDMELVMGISDGVIVLDSGRCIAQGTPSEIVRNPLVLEAYLGRASVTA